MRIEIRGGNGRRLKLPADEAHKAIQRGSAEPVDPEAYEAYVASLGQVAESPASELPAIEQPDGDGLAEPEGDGELVADEASEVEAVVEDAPLVLPPGYGMEGPRGGWYKVLDPQGRSIGKARGEDAAIRKAIKHHSEG